MKSLYGLLIIPSLALGQWTSTRTGTDDWQCQTAAGVKITGHVQVIEAIESCSNKTVSDGVTRYVVPTAKYTIRRTGQSSSSSSSSALTAVLSWTPPTANTDGSSLGNLAGYRIYYGTSAASLNRSTAIGLGSSYSLSLPSSGTWYFAIAAVNSAGVESSLSQVVSVAK